MLYFVPYLCVVAVHKCNFIYSNWLHMGRLKTIPSGPAPHRLGTTNDRASLLNHSSSEQSRIPQPSLANTMYVPCFDLHQALVDHMKSFSDTAEVALHTWMCNVPRRTILFKMRSTTIMWDVIRGESCCDLPNGVPVDLSPLWAIVDG